MRVSERGILAGLALVLLAFSTIGQTQIFQSQGGEASSWEGSLGFYLPFALFAIVSTYHFLDWARKHRRQAIIMFLTMTALTSLLGVGVANAPRPSGTIIHSVTFEQLITANQPPAKGGQIDRAALALTETFQNFRQVLGTTPYLSTSFNALTLIATAVAVFLIAMKVRRERRPHEVFNPVQPAEPALGEPNTAREAVIRAYKVVTGSLRRKGVRIVDSDTPFDAWAKLAGDYPALTDPFSRLAALYEEARFSLHTISDNHAKQASWCLEVILEFPVSGATEK